MSNQPPPGDGDGSPVRMIGGYQLIREVGAGAMGEVWLGRDVRLDRNVAIKMMRCEIANDPMYIERFEREARAVARLGHPNIVQIYSFGEEAGMVFFAMEWVNGPTVASRIREQGAIARKQALKMVKQVAEALDYACKMGIIHRDIKPGNIMLDQEDRVKVADFGLAKLADQESNMTATGAPMGSPNYMAPEACRGEALDHRADIYSLGVTFFQMLEGKLPFSAPTPMSVMFKQVSEPLPEPQALRLLDNGVWMDVLRKMTAKSINDRYKTYAELLEALDRLDSASTLTGQPAAVPSALFLGTQPTPDPGSLSGNMTVLRPAPVLAAQPRSLGFNWKLIAAGAAVVAIALAGWFIYDDLSTSSVPVQSAYMPIPAGTPDVSSYPPPAAPTASLTSSTSPAPVPTAAPAEQTTASDPYVAVVDSVSPAAGAALRKYDFKTVNRELTNALQAGHVPQTSRPIIEILIAESAKLFDFNEVLLAGAAQRPGASRMHHASYGDLVLIGGSSDSFKFRASSGVVEIPLQEITPLNMVLMGAPHNQPSNYKTKVDAFISFWPSVRDALPPPGQGPGPQGQNGEPPQSMGAGQYPGGLQGQRGAGQRDANSQGGPRTMGGPTPQGGRRPGPEANRQR